MCGILCIVTCEGRSIDCGAVERTAVDRFPETTVEAQELTPASFDSTLAHRGPDVVETASVACSGASVELFGSLLQLRGSTTTRALKRSGQCVLCFNGELYSGLSLGEAENDGDALCAALVAVDTDIVATLSRLRGPWAFAFWDGDTLWFGRDVFGRRRHAVMSAFLPMCCQLTPVVNLSLLIRRPTAADARMLLASTVPLDADAVSGWDELPPGVYSLPLLATGRPLVCHHDWASGHLQALWPYRRCPRAAQAQDVLHALECAVADRCRGRPEGEPLMILFSGGLDSVLLACLADRSMAPGVDIDLCNVCFAGGASADRLAARLAVEELRRVAPARVFRLVEINATLQDVDARRRHLTRLLHPAATVMDLNIGAALHIAARGRGVVDGANGPCDYFSSSRVVLLGTGADEQAAGYGRHRTAFRNGGEAGLVSELVEDVNRLWLRNLGRDDRLISDVGREARFPFLDERVVSVLATVPVAALADLTQPPGIGDKLVLRDIARHLGLLETATRAKRAIQFGSGLSKAANVSLFGSGNQANKRNAGTCRLSV